MKNLGGPWGSKMDKKRTLGLYASSDWGPGILTDGTSKTIDVTVTGAQLGDFAKASYSADVQDCQLDAQVTAANTVTVVMSNVTGATVTFAASGEVFVKVDYNFRKTGEI